MTDEELLDKYRRIMDYIHWNGSIWYDEGRKKAYELIALLASNLRMTMPGGKK